jgi:tetratricopeptide (TPR) repeat protein
MTAPVSRRAALAAGVTAAATWLGGSASAAPVPKIDDNSWVGKTVLPKKPDPTVVYKDPPAALPRPGNPDGTPGEVPGTLSAASWEVKSEKGTRIEVIEDGTAFWVEKQEVVRLADAVEFYTKAITADERDAYAYNFRGWARYLLGKPDDAVKDFDEFLKLVPVEAGGHRAVGLSNRGLVLAESGKFDAALKDLNEAVKLGHVPAQLNRGWAYELKGDYIRAADDYAAILNLRPAHVLALNNMAWLRATCPYAECRNGKEAVKLAKQVCELAGNREGMFLDTLAAAHAEAGDFAAAVKAQELALEDKGYVNKHGPDAQKRLQLYKDKKPYHCAPPE